jgi:hypothetical protein
MRREAGLPAAALAGCEALVLLTVARVGAGWSGSFGTGETRGFAKALQRLISHVACNGS